jgi:FkbH-like protein
VSTAELYWLPVDPNWNAALPSIGDTPDNSAWAKLVGLANARLDLVRTIRLDRHLLRMFGATPPPGLTTRPVRLAVLGSSTVDHLHAGIRVAGLRRGLWVTTWQGDYGQYAQALSDPNSSLRQWAPTDVLFALDARHLLRGFPITEAADQAEGRLDAALGELIQQWRIARDTLGAKVIQQTILPVFPTLAGNNEHRLSGSPARLVARLNEHLRVHADAERVDLIAVDRHAAAHGLDAWYDPVLWHRAKQDIHPRATPFYGDLVGRLLAARQGRSFKCLVLDLDNTLWGGVIGDDGLEGIVLGQGSAAGEAFVDFQGYARDLSKRGIILAVCSKNDEANALEPFDKHPDMVLRRGDIACFAASWRDKPTAIRGIAEQLSIGIDALVFADDNPFERDLVRRELPMVAVPELPEDPALYANALADAGYFEAVHLTEEDLQRSGQYQANLQREQIRASATDVEGYLRSLDMELRWGRFDRVGQQRIVQLINKTNQFNLTTRRYIDAEVAEVIADPAVLSLQLRLLDRFGDNGIIALVIGRFVPFDDAIEIDTWLMSCRVLGRLVEEATLNLIAAEATRLGAKTLIGRYIPTTKNGMVKDHYEKLGFAAFDREGDTLWRLDLKDYVPKPIFMRLSGSSL